MIRKWIVFSVLMSLFALTTQAYADQVFATKNGTKYHKESCPLIKNKGAEKIDKAQAMAKGLEPCKKCFKEDIKDDSSVKQNPETKKRQKKS